MKKTIYYSIMIVMIVFSITVPAQKPENHPVADDAKRCASCHQDTSPTKTSHLLLAGIDTACKSCHPRSTANHRIGNVPPFTVPSDLILSPEGTLSCITCHDPHTPRWSDRSWQAQSLAGSVRTMFAKKHKTYFLRRNNAHGDLCLACHRVLKEK